MSGGQTTLTCGLAPGMHVSAYVLGFPLGVTLMLVSEKVLMTQTALLALTDL